PLFPYTTLFRSPSPTRFHALRQAEIPGPDSKGLLHHPARSSARNSEKPAPTKPAKVLAAAQHRVAFELRIVHLWIIQRIMEAAAFFAAQRRVDYQGGDSCEIAQLQQINGHFEIPIELANFAQQVPQPRTRTLEPLIRAHDSDVIPHQASDLIPVVINHDQLIDVLHISRFPFRQLDLLLRSRWGPNGGRRRSMRHYQAF